LRGYRALVSARFRALLQYRSAAIAGFGTQLFWGLIRIMIFEAFFLSSTLSQPMAQEDVITYIWLGQAFLVILPWNPDLELGQEIRSGGVSYELLRPLDLYFNWYSRSIALRTAPAMLRAIPMFIVAGLFFELQAPENFVAGLAFAASMVGMVMLSAAITSVLSISMMWTVSGDGITGLAPAVVAMFSGNIVPLPFFPDALQTVLRILPFSSLGDVQFRLYTGNLPVSELPLVFFHIFGWTLFFILLGRWMVARGVKRVVVQGG